MTNSWAGGPGEDAIVTRAVNAVPYFLHHMGLLWWLSLDGLTIRIYSTKESSVVSAYMITF